MNSYLEAFIRDAKEIARLRGVNWELPVGSDGVAPQGQGWDLTRIASASPPPVTWLNDLGTDAKTVRLLNASPPPGPVRNYTKRPLPMAWQDLIKACAIDQLLVRRNTPPHVSCNVVRPLRVLATCVAQDAPWMTTVDDVKFATEMARKVQPSGKLADLIFGVVRNILDPNHLTDIGPLFPALQRDNSPYKSKSKFAKSLDELRSDLEERKSAEKLPERRAFWELNRIVFTEQPKSFLDLLRFAQVRTLILTGIRDGESVMLPADWKRYREYFDASGRSVDQAGGVARALMLRHFAEKQRVVYEDSTALFETTQFVPLMFEDTLTTTLDQVVTATEPLRRTLQQQVQTGRTLWQFEKGSMVRAIELYTYLTGNPFFTQLQDGDRQRYIEDYQRSYDPNVLERLRWDQLEAVRQCCKLDMAFYVYCHRFTGAPFRHANGQVWAGPRVWTDVYLRVDEVDEYLSRGLPTKRSDLSPIKLANGELAPWELLFLMPKRALAEGRDGGLCDIARYFAVGRMDRQMISNSMSNQSKQTLFETYGQSDEDRALSLRPHSLRHLQNTELFRLGVADTIITKRFNRRKVAQSYEYDHRTLAEELDKVDLKPKVEMLLGEESATVAKLIKSGKFRGPIVKAFQKIQRTQGEDAALEYLRAEADGFHSTPYGHCVNSFMVDPCAKHLECFTGCRHLSATDLPENQHNLVQLQTRLEIAVNTLEHRKSEIAGGTSLPAGDADSSREFGALQHSPKSIVKRLSSGIGLDNQLAHAKTRLEGVRKLLATGPGELVFPDGPDLSQGTNKPVGTVLDDIL